MVDLVLTFDARTSFAFTEGTLWAINEEPIVPVDERWELHFTEGTHEVVHLTDVKWSQHADPDPETTLTARFISDQNWRPWRHV